MAGGNSLNQFTEFVNLTGPTILTSATDVVNDAQKTNYKTLGYMLRGQGMDRTIRGGQTIRDIIYLDATRRSRSYKPNQTQTVANVQTGHVIDIDWRFYITEVVWTAEEILLNGGGSDLSAEARFHKFKDLWWRKKQQCYTDAMDHMEELLWAPPNEAEMETNTGQEMFSIPCFIHENSLVDEDGTAVTPGQLNLAGLPFDPDGVVWAGTTVAGIAPTAANNALKWRNVVYQYGGSSTTVPAGFVVGNVNNVLVFLDRAYNATDFQPPPMFKEYFESPQKQQSPMPFIACSNDGYVRLVSLYRESQDRWVDLSDPFRKPTYGGAPIVYVAQLDTAAIYDTGTALSHEQDADINGPRFYGIQPQYLSPIFHTDRYFESLGVLTDRDQPTTHVMPVNTYTNLFPRSRRRHFLLTPEVAH